MQSSTRVVDKRGRGGGNNNTILGFQTVDYTYNIRGWLLSINDVNDLSSTEDLFAFKLNYNTVENDLGGNITPLYNGNISETFWTTTDHTQRKYGYAYDQLNRLNDAIYQNLDSGTTNSYDELIRYDKNGNIKQLQRNGYLDSNVPYQIDDLSYSYNTLSNTLTNVIDHSNSADGFKDVPALPGNVHYEYDDYGNLKYDKKKDMVLSYNHLNLPLTIKFIGPADEGYINYTYNALGAKVRKIVLDNLTQQQTTTEYLAGGFQYKDSKLEFFPTPEGYVNVTEDQLYNYVYNYTDHLGNMRLSYTFDLAEGRLAVLQENHYYPFGMKHINYGVLETDYQSDKVTGQMYAVIEPVATNKFKYKYNGKEYQDELNLNLYDYGARNYDPAIGRWMNMDPLAETSRRYSPYTYALNNPVFFIDPDGMEAQSSSGEETMTKNDIDVKVDIGYGRMREVSQISGAIEYSGATKVLNEKGQEKFKAATIKDFVHSLDDQKNGYSLSKADVKRIKDNYPSPSGKKAVSVDELITKIGGAIQTLYNKHETFYDELQGNTCALRLSYAMNKAGYTVNGDYDGSSGLTYFTSATRMTNNFLMKFNGQYTYPDPQDVASTGLFAQYRANGTVLHVDVSYEGNYGTNRYAAAKNINWYPIIH